MSSVLPNREDFTWRAGRSVSSQTLTVNSTTLYPLQTVVVVAATAIIAWFLGRPGQCASCGVRLAMKKGFCHEREKKRRTNIVSPHSITWQIEKGRASRPGVCLCCTFCTALILVPSMGYLPFESGVKWLLGLSVVVGGLIWVLLTFKRSAACRSRGEVPYGSHCSHGGSGGNDAPRSRSSQLLPIPQIGRARPQAVCTARCWPKKTDAPRCAACACPEVQECQ